MDSNEYLRRISELAEIKQRKPARTNASGRLPKEIVIEVDEFGEEVEVERTVKLENETLGFDIVKLKHPATICELGCGNVVQGQKIDYRHNYYPYPHWRIKCVTCGKHLGPDGQTLCDTGQQAQALFYAESFRRK